MIIEELRTLKKGVEYDYRKLFPFFLILFFIQLGCAPTLKDWVKERGYTYYADYSTINILGHEIYNNQLKNNPYLSIYSKKGDIPDVIHERNRTFKVEGSAEIENFLKTITGGNVTGKFELSATAKILLEKPFKEEAAAFIPLAPCDNRITSIVTKVLNTGNMKVKVKDKNGIDITATFKPKQTGEVKGGMLIEFADEITLSGKGFYVGYLSEIQRCNKVKEKEIILKKGVEFYDSEIGIYTMLVDYRKKGYLGEALIYISPSNFIGLQESQIETEILVAKAKSWSEMSTQGGLIAFTGDPWKEAISPSQENSIAPWRLTRAESYRLKFGDHLGIPGIPNVSGLYIEVSSVKEQEVKLKIHHIRYEDIKKMQ